MMLKKIVNILLGMSKGRDVKLVFEDFIKYIAYAMRLKVLAFCVDNNLGLIKKDIDKGLKESLNLNYKYEELSDIRAHYYQLWMLLLDIGKTTSPHNVIFEIAKELGLSTTPYDKSCVYTDVIPQGDCSSGYIENGNVDKICEYVSRKISDGYEYREDFKVSGSYYHDIQLYAAYIVLNLYDIPAHLMFNKGSDKGVWNTKQALVNWFSPIEPEEIAI